MLFFRLVRVSVPWVYLSIPSLQLVPLKQHHGDVKAARVCNVHTVAEAVEEEFVEFANVELWLAIGSDTWTSPFIDRRFDDHLVLSPAVHPISIRASFPGPESSEVVPEFFKPG